jgi:hypothetical protein
MSATATTSVTARVPIAIRRPAGRKVIITPDGASAPGATAALQMRGDPALAKAPARAQRWRRLLEDGRYRSQWGLAAAGRVDRGYIARTLPLTLLAPDIVEAILDGRLGAEGLESSAPAEPFPVDWRSQVAAQRSA